ncbi:DHA2 family efflux MFS transporter permease subunit [Aquibacillus koreensis]|uniref:DHA2 family efflux MFS transporter permease subunit n=1 Tax=Aquibacillus koreensis TaxID=279446 RepID=A0A9X4AGT0_9BACI|nr:MDR family MFS transporter [Aquibacillus koreensis]MCT2536520.1 DHA2 family efflux MFS transporter permease subunit [Aquibacillus koreensis]MDC3419392.1 DHA2 family efflux MFS transporter permease subunit [Aquibacillus koreensis]
MGEQINNFDKENLKTGPMLAVLLIGAFVGILNETLLATALPSIMDDLGVTENKVQWLTTAFLLTNGVMIPISAFLIERFTTRKLFLTAFSIFGLGTFISSIAHVFPVLLAGRIVQATGSGIMLPLMMTVILTVIPKERRGRAMGMAGIVISFGPAIGPTLSGLIIEFFHWRALFYVVLPIVVLTVVLAFFYVKNVTRVTKPKIDILSILLSSFGFGGLLYGFSTAGEHGWEDKIVVISIIAGAVILALFIWRQLKLATPLLQFKVFKFNIFTLALIITMIVMMSMIGAEMVLPMYMQTLRGFSALESGLMLLPGAIVMGIMSPITGMLFDKFGARKLAVPGLAIVAVTTFVFTNLSMDTSFAFMTTIYAIRMFGLAMAMMPVMTAGLNQIPDAWHAHGSAMANTLQQVAGSIGTAILFTILTTSMSNYKPDLSILAGLSEKEAELQVANNAMLHGYNSAFLFASILSLVGMVIALFVTEKAEQKAAKMEKAT